MMSERSFIHESGETMPRFTARQKQALTDERREQIMAAATQVFSQRGFAGARIKDIARAAGIAEGTIYLYFRDKRDLISGIVAAAAHSLAARMADLSGDDERAAIAEIIEDRLTLMREKGALIKVVLARGLVDEEVAEVLREGVLGPVTDLLASRIRAKQREGRLRQVDPIVAARVLMAATLAFGVLSPALGDERLPHSEKRIAAEVADLLVNGMRSRSGAQEPIPAPAGRHGPRGPRA
jgi:AcrR family transcriptional regulator